MWRIGLSFLSGFYGALLDSSELELSPYCPRMVIKMFSKLLLSLKKYHFNGWQKALILQILEFKVLGNECVTFHISTDHLRVSISVFTSGFFAVIGIWLLGSWHIVNCRDIYLIVSMFSAGHYRKYRTAMAGQATASVWTSKWGWKKAKNTRILNATMAPTGSKNYVETLAVCVRTSVPEWLCVVMMMLPGFCFGFLARSAVHKKSIKRVYVISLECVNIISADKSLNQTKGEWNIR